MRNDWPRPWVVVVHQEDSPPIVWGYKTEAEALSTMMELLGLDEDEVVDDLEAWHEGNGWWCNDGVRVTYQKLEYPVE